MDLFQSQSTWGTAPHLNSPACQTLSSSNSPSNRASKEKTGSCQESQSQVDLSCSCVRTGTFFLWPLFPTGGDLASWDIFENVLIEFR